VERMASAVPDWLRECKLQALKSEEWRNLLGEAFRRTKEELSHDHIAYFSELKHEEKALYMSRVEEALKGTPAYSNFSIMLRQAVDTAASASIAEEIAAGRHSQGTTKIDVLLDKAATASAALLKQWPRNYKYLNFMLNRPFPGALRRNAWELLLVRHDIRTDYEEKIAKKPATTISAKDADIMQRCQRLLVSEFADLVSSSRLAVTMMKTVLSYVHVISGSERLLEQDPALLYLAIPLLGVFQHECDSGDAAFIMERYCGILTLARPTVLHNTGPEVEFKSRLVLIVERHDSDLGTLLQQDSGPKAAVSAAIVSCAKTLWDQMFVGLTKMDVVLFVWDQCLCTKLQLLLPLCAAMLTLTRRELLAAKSNIEATDSILGFAKVVSVEALQQEMEQKFHEELVAAGMPSFDIVGKSNAPFLFAEDLGVMGQSGNPMTEPSRKQPAGYAGSPLAVSSMKSNTESANRLPAAADSNPLIQAMVGVVDKAKKGTEALDKKIL